MKPRREVHFRDTGQQRYWSKGEQWPEERGDLEKKRYSSLGINAQRKGAPSEQEGEKM